MHTNSLSSPTSTIAVDPCRCTRCLRKRAKAREDLLARAKLATIATRGQRAEVALAQAQARAYGTEVAQQLARKRAAARRAALDAALGVAS